MSEKYFYHGIDITMDVYEKIRRVVETISENEAISFEKAYQKFVESTVYDNLQNSNTMMWSESSEYIVDEYYRRKEKAVAL